MIGFLSNVAFSPEFCNLSYLCSNSREDICLDFRFIASVAALDQKHSVYTCTVEAYARGGETKGMRVERGERRERKSTTLRVRLPRSRFSFFCFALVTDSLALRYNHLEGYETILVARSDNLSRVSLQFYFASLASFFLLEYNLLFICIQSEM